jgi:hypothetical protein
MEKFQIVSESQFCSCDEESPKVSYSQTSYSSLNSENSTESVEKFLEIENKIIKFLESEGIRFVDPLDKVENFWEERKVFLMTQISNLSSNELTTKLNGKISKCKQKKSKTL